MNISIGDLFVSKLCYHVFYITGINNGQIEHTTIFKMNDNTQIIRNNRGFNFYGYKHFKVKKV